MQSPSRDGFLRFDWGFWNPKGKASAKPTTMDERKDEAPLGERRDKIQYREKERERERTKMVKSKQRVMGVGRVRNLSLFAKLPDV